MHVILLSQAKSVAILSQAQALSVINNKHKICAKVRKFKQSQVLLDTFYFDPFFFLPYETLLNQRPDRSMQDNG